MGLGNIATHQGETINAIWFVIAAAGVYLVAFRFYSAWICAKVLVLTRPGPRRRRFNNGRDFVPTNKWVVFGHHRAIAGPGPLIGPTRQCNRLSARHDLDPGRGGTGGCVQGMVIMFCSTRRDGRSLGQMAATSSAPSAAGRWSGP